MFQMDSKTECQLLKVQQNMQPVIYGIKTQLSEMIRLDKDYVHIKKKMQIRDLLHLKEIVDFFSDKVITQNYNTFQTAC